MLTWCDTTLVHKTITMHKRKHSTISKNDIRRLFREQGYNISSWAKANKFSRITVNRALQGRNLGHTALKIRKKAEALIGKR